MPFVFWFFEFEFFLLPFLPPANEVCEGYVFTGVCLSTGGVRGCFWGACVVAPKGACMVAPRWGACMPGGTCVGKGGHMW